jgi:hypothetical protein
MPVPADSAGDSVFFRVAGDFLFLSGRPPGTVHIFEHGTGNSVGMLGIGNAPARAQGSKRRFPAPLNAFRRKDGSFLILVGCESRIVVHHLRNPALAN